MISFEPEMKKKRTKHIPHPKRSEKDLKKVALYERQLQNLKPRTDSKSLATEDSHQLKRASRNRSAPPGEASYSPTKTLVKASMAAATDLKIYYMPH